MPRLWRYSSSVMALQAGKLQSTEIEDESTRANLELVMVPSVPGTGDVEKSGDIVEVGDTFETTTEDNRVLKAVEEFCHLHKEMHDVRENLVALPIEFI